MAARVERISLTSPYELICLFKSGTAPHIDNFGIGDTGRYGTNVLRTNFMLRAEWPLVSDGLNRRLGSRPATAKAINQVLG